MALNMNRNKTLLRYSINKTLSNVAMLNAIENERTLGDGMECHVATPSSDSMSPPQSLKRKEAKFVPYEPYKAAVNHIVSPTNQDKGACRKKKERSLTETLIPFPLLVDGNDSVIRVLRESCPPPPPLSPSPLGSSHFAERELQWIEERSQLECEIATLRNDKRNVENQFKVQAQVNCDLKKLLVASMGEDMQSRVQFLSEDKARLAEDIRAYSKMLLDEHEEIERLAIQSDIWRSKFLACSLMVDELANWKAVLSRKYEEAKESIEWLLEERKEMKNNNQNTLCILKDLSKTFDPTRRVNRPASITSLSMCRDSTQLAMELHFRLMGCKPTYNATANETQTTPAEELARKVLSTTEDINLEASNAKPSNAARKANSRICRFHSALNLGGCRHCSGEINVI